jgi:hypothetical protein
MQYLSISALKSEEIERFSLLGPKEITIANQATNSTIYSYKVYYRDACDVADSTPELRSMVANARPTVGGESAIIAFSPFVNGPPDLNYEVLQKIGQEPWSLVPTNINLTETDSGFLSGTIPNESLSKEICFRVVALSVAGDTLSLSNISCVSNEFALVVPNIVVTSGANENRTWRLKNLESQGPYTLTVYNRWGKTVLSTTSYAQNWPDETDAADTYFYRLAIKGQPELKGWLEVLH